MLYHYVIVRGDVPLGLQCAMIVHAAGESARLAVFLSDDTHAVALRVPDAPALAAVAARLAAAGLTFKPITEDGQLMAIGVMPQPRAAVRRCLSSIPLIK